MKATKILVLPSKNGIMLVQDEIVKIKPILKASRLLTNHPDMSLRVTILSEQEWLSDHLGCDLHTQLHKINKFK